MSPVRTYSQNWMPSIFSDFFDNDWNFNHVKATAPSINVVENKDDFEVEVAAPGMTKDDFQIHINEDGYLVINMEKKSSAEQKDQSGRKYLRREFAYSKFEQTLVLPDNVDKKAIRAEVKDGVLTIGLPKLTEPEQKIAHVIEVH